MMEKFEYTYVAPTEEERKEIDGIRRQYEERGSDKLERLRALHNKVKNLPTAVALILGVVGSLLFGLGMAMILEWSVYLWGIVIGAVGGVLMGIAYPVRAHLLKKGKEKHGEEILRLSKELLGEE